MEAALFHNFYPKLADWASLEQIQDNFSSIHCETSTTILPENLQKRRWDAGLSIRALVEAALFHNFYPKLANWASLEQIQDNVYSIHSETSTTNLPENLQKRPWDAGL